MRTLPLGDTGTRITAIGFGGMALSVKGRPDEHESVEVLHASLDAGVNFIDTADVYCLDDNDIGHNERLIASVLRERPDRDEIHVATKGGLRRPGGEWTNDASPEHLREACERSLEALGTDEIFLYQLHAPDPRVPFEESVGALAELRQQGKIRHVGLSNVSVDQIDTAVKIVPVVSVQNRLNPFFREALEEGVVQACDERGITFLAYSPVGGGRLAKKVPAVPVLREIGDRRGVSPHAVVLAWVRSQGSTVVPIPAASRISSALDSAAAEELDLPAADLERIDEAHFSRA